MKNKLFYYLWILSAFFLISCECAKMTTKTIDVNSPLENTYVLKIDNGDRILSKSELLSGIKNEANLSQEEELVNFSMHLLSNKERGNMHENMYALKAKTVKGNTHVMHLFTSDSSNAYLRSNGKTCVCTSVKSNPCEITLKDGQCRCHSPHINYKKVSIVSNGLKIM